VLRIWTHEVRASHILKSIGKSKALVATLSDTKLEVDSDESDQDGLGSAFTTIVESPKEVVNLIDEEEELIESLACQRFA